MVGHLTVKFWGVVMFRGLLLSGVIVVAAMTSAVADGPKPVRKQPTRSALVTHPPPMWAGFYAGPTLGWAKGRSEGFYQGTTPGPIIIPGPNPGSPAGE